MEIEVLKRSHIKRSIVIGVFIVFIISAIILNFTSAKYRVTDTIPLINGEVNYKVPDLNMVSLYIANEGGTYEEADIIPSNGYALNIEQSYCGQSNNGEIVKDDTIILTYENGSMTFSNVTRKGTKCYLYFDIEETSTSGEQILATKTIDDSRSGAITGTLTTDTTGTVYSAQDDWGTSYVYAGAPTDNWVSFAGFYWRIIRINGDGSIRMIYAGISTSESGTDDQIQVGVYNSANGDNAHVGYMYGSTGASSYSATHANTNDSTIKEILDEWYQNNLTDYANYISTEAGFCNDRRIATSSESWHTNDTKRGYGTNQTYYAPYSRLMTINDSWNSIQNPSLECSQTNDIFTVSGSSKGNHNLTYPIGLITSDEVILAGGFGGIDNQSYYLCTGQNYWTMSPGYHTGSWAGVYYVYNNGNVFGINIRYTTPGIRPVINLSANVMLLGSGTTSDPYHVEGA